MRCFVWGTSNLEERDRAGRGVLAFAIPDLGVQFRAAYQGTASECEYLAFLALLSFVENNPKIFARQKLEAYCDAVLMVYQLNRKASVPASLEKYVRMVRRFQDSHELSVGWVPKEQNFAFTGILELPPVKSHTKISLGTPDTEKNVGSARSAEVHQKF